MHIDNAEQDGPVRIKDMHTVRSTINDIKIGGAMHEFRFFHKSINTTGISASCRAKSMKTLIEYYVLNDSASVMCFLQANYVDLFTRFADGVKLGGDRPAAKAIGVPRSASKTGEVLFEFGLRKIGRH